MEISVAGLIFARSAWMTGITRRISSLAPTAAAPGRVDSPPMSRICAPSRSSPSAWVMTFSMVSKQPPSEKESGVTFTMPMIMPRRVKSQVLRAVRHFEGLVLDGLLIFRYIRDETSQTRHIQIE